MRRQMAVRVVLPPACLSSGATAHEASAWLGELVRTGALQPDDGVYVTEPAGGWIKGDVASLSAGDLEARAGAARRAEALSARERRIGPAGLGRALSLAACADDRPGVSRFDGVPRTGVAAELQIDSRPSKSGSGGSRGEGLSARSRAGTPT